MTKKKDYSVYRVGVFDYDDKNIIYIPSYDFGLWVKGIANILKHNKYSPSVVEDTIQQMKGAFFSISKDVISCPQINKECCKKKFPQDDFKYITCINKKKLGSFHWLEIIFIILLFCLLIKINYNVFTNK